MCHMSGIKEISDIVAKTGVEKPAGAIKEIAERSFQATGNAAANPDQGIKKAESGWTHLKKGLTEKFSLESLIGSTQEKPLKETVPDIYASGRKGSSLTQQDLDRIIAANHDGGKPIASTLKSGLATVGGMIVSALDKRLGSGSGFSLLPEGFDKFGVGGIAKSVFSTVMPKKPLATALGYVCGKEEYITNTSLPLPDDANVVVDTNETFTTLTGSYDKDLNLYIIPQSMVEFVKQTNPELTDEKQALRACVAMHRYANSERGGWLQMAFDGINNSAKSVVAKIENTLTGGKLEAKIDGKVVDKAVEDVTKIADPVKDKKSIVSASVSGLTPEPGGAG